MMTTFIKKGVSATVGLVLVFGTFAIPRPAEAQLAVIDAAVLGTLSAMAGREATKEDVLDAVAWQMANMVLQSVTKSIVNWINSGFNGSPAFVQDLSENLGGVADAVAAEFIGQLADQLKDTPMRGTVEAIAYSYYLSTSGDAFLRKQLYTLRNVVQNDEAFVGGDFNEGGWRGWFALTGNRANNPHGTLLNAQAELDRRIESSLETRLTELGWGNGFLSWRVECNAAGAGPATYGADGSITSLGASTPGVSLGGAELCMDYKIETPGSVIQEQLNKTLGTSDDRLKVADEVNEIVGALVSQLVTQALQGLSSIGSVSSGGNGYIDRATSPEENPSGVDTLLVSGIEAQVTQLASYQQNWIKINTAADAALQCSAATDSEREKANNAKRDADVALLRAGTTLAGLQAILGEINRPLNGVDTSAQLTLLPESAQNFQTLMTSATTPSTTEVEEAATAASDATNPPSLYVELTQIAARCAVTS